MIKGVNRQVLEISSPESPYFERVLFFVKPEYANISENRLRAEANRLAEVKSPPPKRKLQQPGRRMTLYKWAVRITAAASIGAAITAVAVYAW